MQVQTDGRGGGCKTDITLLSTAWTIGGHKQATTFRIDCIVGYKKCILYREKVRTQSLPGDGKCLKVIVSQDLKRPFYFSGFEASSIPRSYLFKFYVFSLLLRKNGSEGHTI